MYAVFVKYLVKNGNNMGQYFSYLRMSWQPVGRVILYSILMEFGLPPLHLPVEEVQLSKEEFDVSVQLVRLIKVNLKFKPVVEPW